MTSNPFEDIDVWRVGFEKRSIYSKKREYISEIDKNNLVTKDD